MTNTTAFSNRHDASLNRRTRPGRSLLRIRRLVATILTLSAGAGFVLLIGRDAQPDAVVYLPVFFLGGAAFLLHVNRFGFQVCARSVLWSNLLLALMLCLFEGPKAGGAPAMIMLLSTGGALMVLGQSRLQRVGKSAPVEFKSTLMLTLLFAFADLQTLIFWGALTATKSNDISLDGTFFLVSSMIMLTAIIGLMQLKVWGVILNVIANFGIAFFALTALELPAPVIILLSSTAFIQLFLATPFWLTLFGMKSARTELKDSHKALIANGVLIAIMATGLLFFGQG